jgi:TetR/AcrR family transcriptional regulator, regulator of cefoperazone and chloramphenicol sensitivity
VFRLPYIDADEMYVNCNRLEAKLSETPASHPASPGPRRRPAGGGYARGDAKRTRIIEAALRRFAEDGYEGASTRQIAQEAGVNPPALQYYFDSKEGLYLACFRHIVDGFSAAMREAYARSAAVAPDDPAGARVVFCEVLDAMADFVFETAETRGWLRFHARVKAGEAPGSVDKLAEASIEDELFGHCFRLVAIATGGSPDSAETRLRCMAAMGTITAFHHERDNILARLGWPDLRGPRLACFKALLRQQATATLAG